MCKLCDGNGGLALTCEGCGRLICLDIEAVEESDLLGMAVESADGGVLCRECAAAWVDDEDRPVLTEASTEANEAREGEITASVEQVGDYRIVRSKAEIEDLIKRCGDAEFAGTSAFPKMSYEQGVLYGISWLIESDDEADPLEA